MGRKEILEKIGEISQLGGQKSYIFNDGPAKGIRAVDMKSPCGLDFTVLLDRGMDISSLTYKGIPLHWRSLTKEVSPYLFESKGDGWLRSFYGGLFSTCGLTYHSWACVDNGEELGMHGRASNLIAEHIYYDGAWEEDDYFMWVQGKLREVKIFENKLELTRKISTSMGTPVIKIEDRIKNIGAGQSPIMVLYHFNFGFPLLSENSIFSAPVTAVSAGNGPATGAENSYDKLYAPQDVWDDQLFFLETKANEKDMVNFSLTNPKLNSGGIGLKISYKQKELPCLTIWKKMGKYGDYVLGIEPGNNFVTSRKIEREKGTLQFLEPGEEYSVTINLEVEYNNT